jgi:hypothetical protein
MKKRMYWLARWSAAEDRHIDYTVNGRLKKWKTKEAAKRNQDFMNSQFKYVPAHLDDGARYLLCWTSYEE